MDDEYGWVLKFLCTLACCASWFVLSWMFVLHYPGLDLTVGIVFWILFGFLGIAGLIDKPGGRSSDPLGKTKIEK